MSSPQRGTRAQASPEPELFARRATTIYPPPNGADIVFCCSDHEGRIYFCKGDRPGHRTRATELICTKLADRLGIRTAHWSVIEHNDGTYFGSQQEISSAGPFEVQHFLATPRLNELGGASRFPGEYLAQLYALDLFLNNPDRGFHNFLLVRDGAIQRICAIDFASGNLADLTSERFPVADCPTLIVGKRLRAIHGAFANSAIEMVDRIMGLPSETFAGIVAEVPADWLLPEERGGLIEVWNSSGCRSRLSALRAGLVDGTLV